MAKTNYQKAALRAFFDLGIDVDRYLEQAIRSGAANPADVAYALIIRSPEFKKRFPGIFRKDGTLRMSPSDYIHREDAFRSVAAQYGFSLSKSAIGGLMNNNVTPESFTLRARGIQLASTRPDILKTLNDQIARVNKARAAHGDALIPMIRTTKDAVNFFTGKSDGTVYALYEGAQFEAAARSAGLKATATSAATIARGTAGVMSLEDIETGYASIASRLRTAGVELKSFGITQRELEILEFGGPGRAGIAGKAEQALKQRETALQSNTTQAPSGLNHQGRPITASQVAPGY